MKRKTLCICSYFYRENKREKAGDYERMETKTVRRRKKGRVPEGGDARIEALKRRKGGDVDV